MRRQDRDVVGGAAPALVPPYIGGVPYDGVDHAAADGEGRDDTSVFEPAHGGRGTAFDGDTGERAAMLRGARRCHWVVMGYEEVRTGDGEADAGTG